MTRFNFGNTKTDKWGFRHTCSVATATQNLEDFYNSNLWTCPHDKKRKHKYQEVKIKCWFLDDNWSDCVTLKTRADDCAIGSMP